MEKSERNQLRCRLRDAVPKFLKRRLLPFEWELEQLAASYCARHASGCLLDVGCGATTYASRSVGLDKDIRCLQLGKGMRVCADAHYLPVRFRSLDAICCSAALHHFEDPLRSLSEMRSCLKPGGELFLSVPGRFPKTKLPDDICRFSRGDVLGLLKETGWRLKQCVPIGGKYWVFSRTLLEWLFRWCHSYTLPLFLLLAPLLGLAIPLCCFYLDGCDQSKEHTLGWMVIALKEG